MALTYLKSLAQKVAKQFYVIIKVVHMLKINVIGGGLAAASKYFMPALLEEMRSKIKTMSGDTLNRVQMSVYNLDNKEEFKKFAEGNSKKIKVYGSDKEVVYDPEKRIGVTISDIGASNAVSLGAYLYALNNI